MVEFYANLKYCPDKSTTILLMSKLAH